MQTGLTRILFIVVVGTLLFSAVLTPLLIEFLRVFKLELNYPFSRIFDRVAMLVALVLVLCFKKQLDLGPLLIFLKQGSWIHRLQVMLIGCAVSLAASLLVFPILVWSGQLLWLNLEIGELLFKALKRAPAAFLVSIIEEGFFRALLFGSLRKSWPLWPALLATSLIYALAHFIIPDKTFLYQGYSPLVGFEYLLAVLRRMLLPGTWKVFVGFVLIGTVLALIINKTRSLYLCIGLHAGWVLALKLLNDATDLAQPALVASGVGGRYFLLSQPLTWFSILLVFGSTLYLSGRLKSMRNQGV